MSAQALSRGVARPELTMPEAEAAALRTAYGEARAILEYGSGGSTVLASELPGKQVVSVESDADWARMMRAWFALNPGRSPVELIHADIGPTRDWGHPADASAWALFPAYPLAVWDRDIAPDVVLVDGRFRAGCALACAFRTRQPLTLLFDDYVPRGAYHAVEEFLGTPEIIGRMAVFDISPTPVPSDRLLRVIELTCAPL
ncbi:hypothetical protein OB2597_03569 [Pseudooceanicola batsensis HTCC2597]|uniref:Class I SAM-dependent methyltransferase n=1 Tax=Pseudooceanicola batsensis (strain ATCC BAA-863 / DSM 15984 / KCTC 12145 / HTCC2597) TaxID=252305 RepID=A3U438_PSEBH|nr:hypothetical protein [Pseudooceanicola batsensis]EAQ01085.1 hypothetical protein OB2597_03569 [Pseudooceanicola batsensis HTCC2597]